MVGESFKTLRTWNGEQSRAFEEISFQLLRGNVPTGAHAIRTGNPDGGVEWYAQLSDGSEWGWQAKYVEGIDALLTAMTDSVKRVAEERPSLRKLTFVISWNLATGTSSGERKSQRKKYEDKVEAWKRSIPGANAIEFDLVQESDLLAELAKPEHNGRRWFWWDHVVLGHDWLEQRYREQAAAASEKYRPDLQVDIPIQEDLLALGFDKSISAIFDKLRREVISAVNDLHLSLKDVEDSSALLYRNILDTAAELRTTANDFTIQAGDPPSILEQLARHLSACTQAIDAAENQEHRLAAEWRKLPDGDPKKSQKPPEYARSYDVRKLLTAAREIIAWLESSTGRAFTQRSYFLTGQAGSGKTHLLLDATRRALDAGRPAVFLAGAQFGRGNLWESVTDQLGLQPVGADVLLRAMDAAGEAAAISGSRFLIFVDAINETTPADFWRTHLPRLRAAIAPYPHVALAVSCRDTYEDLVLEGAEGSHYVRRAHPGFAEREVEATQRYFVHYSLEAPKIPLLTPEFTLPLFLRLYCESLSQAGAAANLISAGHQGRVAIFERYLAVKLLLVARRFQPDASSSYELNAARMRVSRVLDALLDELSNIGRESMSATNADTVAQAAVGGSAVEAIRILGLLQEEGVLTRERLYLGNDTYGEGVRIVFQAFSDFLLLKRRLAQTSDPLNDQSLKAWLMNDCSWGIVEAANIVFPEAYNTELPDFLGVKLSARPKTKTSQATWTRHNRARQLYRSLVETLPYRSSDAISQRTIDLLNAAQRELSRDELYRVLFTIAPQPGNRLNGDGLHRYLLQRHMPQRDSDFGIATYHELSDSSGPVARLARWAAAGPYPTYDAEVIELACIPLCWLLSSPNRFMRDWVTKALVQLLRGHLGVMHALLERFWTVDDPYVVQRVVVIAYGSVLRSTPEQANEAKGLAERVHDLVFTRPIRPDELLLDAARGVVRWAVAHQLLPATALDASRRPYGLKLPGMPPSRAAIEAKYGWKEGQPDDESYSTITFSLFSMGDFARYIVEPGIHHFSRHRINQPYPELKPREPRFIKSRWAKFIASLSDGQKNSLSDWLQDPTQVKSPLSFLISGKDDPLSEEQRNLLKSATVYPKPIDHEYSADLACRWIFQRTLSLGWTPKLFGRQDRMIGHGQGREGHKAERWGKKYQWIAYHELLARVADNYHASRHFGESEPYEGLHQIIGDREIDPSLPPIDYRTFNDNEGSGAAAWGKPLIHLKEWPPNALDFDRFRGDVQRFLADTKSEPKISNSMLVHDAGGVEWLILQSFLKHVDPKADRGWRGLYQRGGVDTLFVRAGESKPFISALRKESRNDIHFLVDSNGHTDCCYVGEVGRISPCPYRHSALVPTEVGGKQFGVSPTIEKYLWEGGILDCSIGESASTVLPCTLLQQNAGLSFDMRGPSWLDASGSPVFTYYEEPGNESHALLVRASFMRDFLTKANIELIAVLWFERMDLSSDRRDKSPYIESTSMAWFDSTLKPHVSKPTRTERNLE